MNGEDCMQKEKMSRSEAGRLGAASEKYALYRKHKHEETIARYLSNPVRCRKCGKVLPWEQRVNVFCSRSCAAAYNNKGLVRNPTGTNGIIREKKAESRKRNPVRQSEFVLPAALPIRLCVRCGNKLKSTQKEYCSDECRLANMWDLKKKQIIESGKFPCNERINDTDRRVAKRFLIETNGHKCAICGGEVWNNQPIPLITDHIDGDSTNHSIDNFRLICPNCDAQTNTYKSRGNRTSTRIWRKQYYKSANSKN